MSGPDISGDSFTSQILKNQLNLEKSERQQARQIDSQESFIDSTEEGNQYIASVIAKKLRQKAKTLEERSGKKEKVKSEAMVSATEAATEIEEENPELSVKMLLLLRSKLKDDDSPDEILKKVLESYSDYSLADDALEFLQRSTDDKLLENIKKCRENFKDEFGREIKAGKNMAQEAREFSKQGLGAPTALRDMYRDITGNPRSPNKLFEEFSLKLPFEKMETVIKFLLHSLGSDLKSKGPSIPRGELFRLLTETRNMQAILGVYRFFQSRMGIIFRTFDKYHLFLPKKVTFEMLAKMFMRMLEDRYPSSVKVIKLAKDLDVDDEVLAQIIIFSQGRDAIRQVAPKLFRSIKHRNELLTSFIEALEELEDLLEEEEEED